LKTPKAESLKEKIVSHHHGDHCFNWALDPYIINFRFCLAVVSDLKLPDEQKKLM